MSVTMQKSKDLIKVAEGEMAVYVIREGIALYLQFSFMGEAWASKDPMNLSPSLSIALGNALIELARKD